MTHGILLAAAAWAAVLLIFLTINLASVARLGHAPPDPRIPSAEPSVSIVIPARNEEREIEAAVRSQLSQEYSDFEVIVVDDCSSDATGAILAALAREDSRLRVIAGVEPPAGWLGKPHALSEGSRAASGELILFADADVRYDARCLAQAVRFLSAEQADFLALLPRLEARGFWENVLMPNLLFLFYCGPAFLANEDRARWLAVGGGAGNLIRRSVYDAIGGHEALKGSVIDDVHLALSVKRAGFRARVARAENLVAVRMYRGFRGVWDGFAKNAAYLFSGGMGALLLLYLLATLVLAVAPVAVLTAAVLRVPIPADDVRLAAAAFLLLVLTRASLALAIGEALWPSWTHPIMAAVWTGIIGRSLFHRVVQRRLTWRGREFDARAARF